MNHPDSAFPVDESIDGLIWQFPDGTVAGATFVLGQAVEDITTCQRLPKSLGWDGRVIGIRVRFETEPDRGAYGEPLDWTPVELPPELIPEVRRVLHTDNSEAWYEPNELIASLVRPPGKFPSIPNEIPPPETPPESGPEPLPTTVEIKLRGSGGSNRGNEIRINGDRIPKVVSFELTAAVDEMHRLTITQLVDEVSVAIDEAEEMAISLGPEEAPQETRSHRRSAILIGYVILLGAVIVLLFGGPVVAGLWKVLKELL